MPKAQEGMEMQQPQGQPQGGGSGDQMQQLAQQVQQMMQQGAAPEQVVAQLLQGGIPPEAIMQVMVQLGMPQEQVQPLIEGVMQQMQGGQPQGQEATPEGQPMMQDGGEAEQQEQIMQLIQMFAQIQGVDPNQIMEQLQGASPEEQQQMMQQMVQTVQESQGGGQPMAQPSQAEQMQMMLGGTKEDFESIRKKKIKEYRKGGITDEKSLDSTSTEGYVTGLSDALRKVMYTGFAVNNVNEKYGNVKKAFDEIPKADNGYENKATPTVADLKNVGHTPESFSQLTKEEREAIYMQMPKKPAVTATETTTDLGVKTGAVGTTSAGTSLTAAELARAKELGINDPGFSPDGTRERILQADRNSWIDQQRNNQGGSQKGIVNGGINPNANNPYYNGFPGKQDHYYPGWNAERTPYGGDWRNNSYWGQRAGMQPAMDMIDAFSRENGRGPYNAGIDFQGFGEHTGMNYQQFVDSLGPDTDVSLTPIWEKNIFGKEKRHKKKNVAAYRFDTIRNNGTQGGSSANNNAGQENPYTFDEMLSREGYTREMYDNDPAIRRDMDSLGYKPEGSSASTGTVDAGITEGQVSSMQSADDKALAAAKAAGLEGKPESEYTDEDWAKWEENYQYMKGGSVKKYGEGGQHIGTPFKWCGKTGKFIPMAEAGMSFDASKFADGAMGVGYQLSTFLDDMNAYKRDQNDVTRRSLDNIGIVQPAHSGDEGVYWENLKKQMAQDTGADVLPGTGSDWAGFGQGQRTFKDSFITGAYANGGLTKSATGMEKGSEHTLSDDQVKLLQKAGYTLKQLY